jgi:23S rRNA (guanosine2251-2'-O)-methyltransferase
MAINREKVFIYGKHALSEALLHAPQVVQKVYLAGGAATPEMRKALQQHDIPTAPIKSQQGVSRDAAHQGVIALINPAKLFVPLDAFLETVDIRRNPCVVVLDELHDPQNLGAIVRSAAAFGAAGVVIPARHQAPVSGAAVKASVGMVFRIPLIVVESAESAVKAFKHRGFISYALAMKGSRDVTKEQFEKPTVFVVGNEGSGVRSQTLGLCDVRLRIPMHPRTESLNAAVSASTVLYQWSMQHPEWLVA